MGESQQKQCVVEVKVREYIHSLAQSSVDAVEHKDDNNAGGDSQQVANHPQCGADTRVVVGAWFSFGYQQRCRPSPWSRAGKVVLNVEMSGWCCVCIIVPGSAVEAALVAAIRTRLLRMWLVVSGLSKDHGSFASVF